MLGRKGWAFQKQKLSWRNVKSCGLAEQVSDIPFTRKKWNVCGQFECFMTCVQRAEHRYSFCSPRMAFSWGSFILGEEHPCSVEKIPSSTAPRPGCPSMADVLAELQLDPVLRTGVQVTLLLTNHWGGYFLVTWKQIPWKWQNHLAMLDSKLCLGCCDCFVVVCCYENRKLLWKYIDFI